MVMPRKENSTCKRGHTKDRSRNGNGKWRCRLCDKLRKGLQPVKGHRSYCRLCKVSVSRQLMPRTEGSAIREVCIDCYARAHRCSPEVALQSSLAPRLLTHQSVSRLLGQQGRVSPDLERVSGSVEK